jgi:hypothetical protein
MILIPTFILPINVHQAAGERRKNPAFNLRSGIFNSVQSFFILFMVKK